MALFVSDAKERMLRLCYLISTDVTEKDIIENHGFSKEEVEEVRKDYLPRFDKYNYARGNLRKALRRK